MPRLHAIELLPDEAGADAVRRGWLALRETGLPSMLDHTGASNTPHITVIAVPQITPADEDEAVARLAPLLPIQAGLSGLVVFGGPRVTLARVVDIPDPVISAVLEVRSATRGHQHPGWLPHATLGRRIPRGRLQEAVDALDVTDAPLTLTSLRRWDPEVNQVRALSPL